MIQHTSSDNSDHSPKHNFSHHMERGAIYQYCDKQKSPSITHTARVNGQLNCLCRRI